jgi:putative spermidine/putrescine transport system substrate-binding protein
MQMTLTRPIRWLMGAAVAVALPASVHAQTLTIVSWGGAYQTSQREAYFKPFTEKTGIKIVETEYAGELSKIAAMVKAGSVTWDVVDLGSDIALSGCDEGDLVPFDYDKIRPKNQFIEGATDDCGVGTIVYSTIIAYDADKIKTDPPTKVADFFDLTKYPGKRSMQKNPMETFEFALMADGVPPDKVYATLKTKAGVDEALKKLDTIKKEIVWWTAGAQPPQFLASGEVVMTTAWNGRIYDADKNDHKNFKIVWDGQIQDFDYWGVPKGTKNLDAAMQFVKFASDPSVMANQSKYISYGPVLTDAIPHIPTDVLKDLPTAPENSKNVLDLDAQFWADHGDDLRKQFDAWLAQ